MKSPAEWFSLLVAMIAILNSIAILVITATQANVKRRVIRLEAKVRALNQRRP